MDLCESENCGSNSFRTGDDGFTYCSEGHRQLSRGTQVAEENEGAPQFGRKARRQGEEEEATDTTLSGRRAFEHYLLCFQLVLWKQVNWLVSVKGFPAELETVVRDLWALRVQTLQSRASYDSESEAEQSSQYFSSQDETEATDATARRKTRKSKTEAIPQLVDAISLCYIGCLLLRLPTSVNDFYCWVVGGELIYYRAVRVLALPMKQRLPFNYNQILDPQTLLNPSSVHRAVLENIVAYHQSFGMLTPPLNHVLLLYRWVRNLALPLEVYAAVLHISSMLDVNFSYETEEQPRRSKLLVLRLAEAKLMCLLVLATKLLFPTDVIKRYPRKPTELSALAMDWSAWSAARREYDQSAKEATHLGYEDALRVSEQDVLQMSDDKLDEYMDWYGDIFASEDVREKGRVGREAEFRRMMFRYFPIDRPKDQPVQDDGSDQQTDPSSSLRDTRVKDVQAALRPIRVKQDGESVKEGEVLRRPGSDYQRYREASELTGYAEEFYREAAKVSGLSLELLVRGVFTFERRLEDLENEARKAEYGNG